MISIGPGGGRSNGFAQVATSSDGFDVAECGKTVAPLSYWSGCAQLAKWGVRRLSTKEDRRVVVGRAKSDVGQDTRSQGNQRQSAAG